MPDTGKPHTAKKRCSHHHRPVKHSHSEEHNHSHEFHLHRPKQRRALLICVLLTLSMMVIEFISGIMFGSLMLISDAIHMLSHASALGISYFAVRIASRKVSGKYPFGLFRTEILAALFNGIGLAGFSVWIVFEAVDRLINPLNVIGPELTYVAIAGLAVNLLTALILWRSGVEDLNTKSAFLHMLADTFSSVVIIAGGIVITFTGINMVDPVLSIVVAVMVAKWSWGLLHESVFILLEKTPDSINMENLVTHIMEKFPVIKDIHDLHIWEITTQFVCASLHVVTGDRKLSELETLREDINHELIHYFGIGHCVIQFEHG